MSAKRGIWFLCAGVVAALTALWLYARTSGNMPDIVPEPREVQATFICDGGKSVDAEFTTLLASTSVSGMVALQLSDGRRMMLSQSISASGARYVNEDASFVFWNKGNTAFITENGLETYTGCRTGQ